MGEMVGTIGVAKRIHHLIKYEPIYGPLGYKSGYYGVALCGWAGLAQIWGPTKITCGACRRKKNQQRHYGEHPPKLLPQSRHNSHG